MVGIQWRAMRRLAVLPLQTTPLPATRQPLQMDTVAVFVYDVAASATCSRRRCLPDHLSTF